jgi:hypothetical protein
VVRVRIVQAITGVLEGHPLSQFRSGFIYDLSEALGIQLIDMQAAVEVRSTDPLSDQIDMPRLTSGVHIEQPTKAEDRPERHRRKKRG